MGKSSLLLDRLVVCYQCCWPWTAVYYLSAYFGHEHEQEHENPIIFVERPFSGRSLLAPTHQSNASLHRGKWSSFSLSSPPFPHRKKKKIGWIGVRWNFLDFAGGRVSVHPLLFFETFPKLILISSLSSQSAPALTSSSSSLLLSSYFD